MPRPPTMASMPSRFTPPDVPGATGRQVRIERGGRDARLPISVAQVSAAEAASAPSAAAVSVRSAAEPGASAAPASAASGEQPAVRQRPGTRRARRPWPRRPPVRCAFSAPRSRESAIDATKYAISSAPHSQPAATAATPTTTAAVAPPKLSACARRAASATVPATSSPASARSITPSCRGQPIVALQRSRACRARVREARRGTWVRARVADARVVAMRADCRSRN